MVHYLEHCLINYLLPTSLLLYDNLCLHHFLQLFSSNSVMIFPSQMVFFLHRFFLHRWCSNIQYWGIELLDTSVTMIPTSFCLRRKVVRSESLVCASLTFWISLSTNCSIKKIIHLLSFGRLRDTEAVHF